MTETCAQIGPMCMACTEPKGHDGPHVAATRTPDFHHTDCVWSQS